MTDLKIFKTEVPDGIEQGKFAMRKLLLLLFAIISVSSLTSCVKDFMDGYEAGAEGYTYLGEYSSESACRSACAYRGYTYYRYNYSLNNCYCK